jgi:hypothetical protein
MDFSALNPVGHTIVTKNQRRSHILTMQGKINTKTLEQVLGKFSGWVDLKKRQIVVYPARPKRKREVSRKIPKVYKEYHKKWPGILSQILALGKNRVVFTIEQFGAKVIISNVERFSVQNIKCLSSAIMFDFDAGVLCTTISKECRRKVLTVPFRVPKEKCPPPLQSQNL